LPNPPPSKEYQDLYRAGIAAARSKDFERARRLFQAAVTVDEGQKGGWLALARLEREPEKKAEYYRRVLRIDPKDAVARAFLDGMRHRRHPWYRSRRGAGALALLALFLGGALVLVALNPRQEAGGVLPTSAQLPSLTPTIEMQAGALLSINAATENVEAVQTVTEEPQLPLQVTFVRLDVSSPTAVIVDTATLPPAAPQPTASPTAPAPTVVFVPPPPSVPTATPGSGIVLPTYVTVPPTATSAPGITPTQQPLFMDITEPPPTGLPVFATPTDEFQGDFNTEVPPTDQTFPEDPNSGGGRQP